MLIDSLRFGSLDVPDNRVITMIRPILGFEHLSSFCLVEHDDLRPFMWLQSTDEAHLAFLIVNPALFYPEYRIHINSNEIAELEVAKPDDVETFVIVTIPDTPTEISVNLQGPILINTVNRRAKQLVLTNAAYTVDHRILDAPAMQRSTETMREASPIA